jgi:saxitoxin biosynthesis operon SxtJ-like protein
LETRIPAGLSPAEGRRFGLTLGGAFLALGALAWWRGAGGVAVVAALGVSPALLLAGLLIPQRLGPLYRGWMRFAELLSRITTPVFLGVIYFLVLTPAGLIRRLAGRSAVARPRTAKSFWVARPAGARERADMERRF